MAAKTGPNRNYAEIDVLLDDTLIVGNVDLHTGDDVRRVASIHIAQTDTAILMDKLQVLELVHALLVTAGELPDEVNR